MELSDFHTVPSWLEGRPPRVDQEPLEKSSNAISAIANHFLSYIQEWSLSWNMNAVQLKPIDFQKVIEKIPAMCHEALEDLNELKRKVRDREPVYLYSASSAIAVKLNKLALTLFILNKKLENTPQKLAAADQFVPIPYQIKTYKIYCHVWQNLSSLTKHMCDVVTPYILPPSSDENDYEKDLVQYDLPQYALNSCILLTNDRLRYRLDSHSRGIGQINLKIQNKWMFSYFFCVDSTQPTDLREKIKSSLIHYHPRMNEIAPSYHNRSEDLSREKHENYPKYIEHQKYRLIQYYRDVMFASLHLPVRFPFFVGPEGEYFITPLHKAPEQSLKDHLKNLPQKNHSQVAREVALILENEMMTGMECLKSLELHVQDGTIYPTDFQDIYEIREVPQFINRLENIQNYLLAEYEQFPTFIQEIARQLSHLHKKLTALLLPTISFLPKCRQQYTPEKYTKLLELTAFAFKNDVGLFSINHSAERKSVILRQMVSLLAQMPTKRDVIGSFLDFNIKQFAHQARLEQLVIQDMLLDCMESPLSIDDFFQPTYFQEYLEHFKLNTLKETYFTESDGVKSNSGYFEILFWNEFVNNFFDKIIQRQDHLFLGSVLDFFAHPKEIEKYKTLLHSHIITFNKNRLAKAFLEGIHQFQSFP